MSGLWIIPGALLSAAACVLLSRGFLHLYQLESYQLPGFARSVKRSPARLAPSLLTAAAGLLLWLLRLPAAPVLVLQCLCGLAVFLYYEKKKEKKPFRYTERVRRFLAIHAAVAFPAALAPAAFAGAAWLLLLPAAEVLLFALSALAAEPVERRIAGQFADDAKRRLSAMPGLIRIGITGSYGKTSTKYILSAILGSRWKVLMTPGSFNTTMGVTRVIREMLTPGTEVFIAEMGARHVGDVRELVSLVGPRIGLITSIGPQHLDTFGNVETVAAAKNELIEGLPEDGAAFFARDGAHCERLFGRCALRDKFLAGSLVEIGGVEVGPWGTRFTLTDAASGERADCSMPLLGEHSVRNVQLCADVARYLGMSLREIAAGVARIRPVEHRLQLIRSGEITIIDDAFNSNPAGAKAALDVLSQFKDARRIVVTPGMVELGREGEDYNREFGRQIAERTDVAILVGKRNAAAIAEGIREKGYDESCLHLTASLDEATALLRTIMRAGDVILYENDLPDNY